MSDRKDNLIRVRVTSEQQEKIHKAASSQNKTTSQFVRDKTLEEPKRGLLASILGGGKK